MRFVTFASLSFFGCDRVLTVQTVYWQGFGGGSVYDSYGGSGGRGFYKIFIPTGTTVLLSPWVIFISKA